MSNVIPFPRSRLQRIAMYRALAEAGLMPLDVFLSESNEVETDARQSTARMELRVGPAGGADAPATISRPAKPPRDLGKLGGLGRKLRVVSFSSKDRP